MHFMSRVIFSLVSAPEKNNTNNRQWHRPGGKVSWKLMKEQKWNKEVENKTATSYLTLPFYTTRSSFVLSWWEQTSLRTSANTITTTEMYYNNIEKGSSSASPPRYIAVRKENIVLMRLPMQAKRFQERERMREKISSGPHHSTIEKNERHYREPVSPNQRQPER